MMFCFWGEKIIHISSEVKAERSDSCILKSSSKLCHDNVFLEIGKNNQTVRNIESMYLSVNGIR